MMEKKLFVAASHEEADRHSKEQDDLRTWQERFDAFMKLMEPYYEAAEGLQRICRIDDLKQRQVRDDWRLRVQSVSQPKSDG